MERKLVNTFSKNSSHSAGDEADWSSSARDSANSKSQMFINLNGTKSKSKSKSNATEMKKKKNLSARLFAMVPHLWALPTLAACLVPLSRVKRKQSSFTRPGKQR